MPIPKASIKTGQRMDLRHPYFKWKYFQQRLSMSVSIVIEWVEDQVKESTKIRSGGQSAFLIKTN